MHPIPHAPLHCPHQRILKAAAMCVLLMALSPLWLTAQQRPLHATPAPMNGGMPGQPMMGRPRQTGQGQPIQQLPQQPGQPTPAPTPAGVQPPTPTPIPAPSAPPVVTPSTAPQLVYEGAPTTSTIRGMGGTGAGPKGPGEALPTAAPESPTISGVMVRQKTPEEIFNTIRTKTGVRVKAMGSVNSKKIDVIQPQAIPVEQLLTNIATQNQWTWVQMADGSYEMHDAASLKALQARMTTQKVYQLHFIDADELLKVVQPLLTPEIAAAAADARSNKLIVTDLPSKLALIDSIIREYDVQVYTHVFEIKHANLDEVKDQLDQIKSKAGEMFVDPLNRTVVVKDTFDKIKMMEQLIQILDRDVEMRVYNLLNIGLDGQFADDFISKFIEPLKSSSESAVMEFNEATGKLFVRDVRSVHDKILQILRQIDVPRKQVRIEGEIVSVAVNHQLSIGTDWAYSPNLKGAINNNQGGLGSETGFNKIGLPLVTGGSSGLTVLELTDNIKAQLTAALTDTRTRLLLRPRITIANNEQGEFNVTRDEPVLQTYNYGYYGATTSNNFSSGQMTYRSGLQVRIHPTISNRGLVEMEIEFINSTPIIVDNIGNGVRGVGSTEESANTILVVPSGETRVIGGLISRDISEGKSGIPYLSEVPWVGWLFGKKSDTNNLRNLMFFITPTIVEEQPLNADIVEPVNEAAQFSLKQAQQAVTPPAPVNEIPPELRPYLKEVQPEGVPMPESGQTGTTGTTETMGGPVGTVTDEEAITSAPMGSGASFLTNEPYTEANKAAGELRMGGTMPAQTAGKGAAGPTGVFGAAAGGAPPRATAGAKAAAPGAAAGATTAGKAATATPGAKTPSATGRTRGESTRQSRERSSYGTSRYRGGQGMMGGPYGGGSQYSPGTSGGSSGETGTTPGQ
jgi:type II secretory pathway component GspD/PulD (secretin)